MSSLKIYISLYVCDNDEVEIDWALQQLLLQQLLLQQFMLLKIVV